MLICELSGNLYVHPIRPGASRVAVSLPLGRQPMRHRTAEGEDAALVRDHRFQPNSTDRLRAGRYRTMLSSFTFSVQYEYLWRPSDDGAAVSIDWPGGNGADRDAAEVTEPYTAGA
jgi:hypothetical protein